MAKKELQSKLLLALEREMQFAFRAAENVGAAKGPHMMGWWGIHDCRCIIRAQVSELPGLLWIAEPLLHQLCCEFLHYNYLVVLLGRLSHCFPSNVIAAAALVCGGLFTSSFSYFFLMSKWYGRVPGKLVLILPLDVAGTCRGIDSHSPPPPPSHYILFLGCQCLGSRFQVSPI